MKAHWQRGMLVSGLALIGWVMVAFSVQASTPQGQGTRSETPARVSSQIGTTPVSDTAVYTWYFPIIIRPPGMLYGTVTEYGLPAADVTLALAQMFDVVHQSRRSIWSAQTWDIVYSHNRSQRLVCVYRSAYITDPEPVSSSSQIYNAYWINWPTRPIVWPVGARGQSTITRRATSSILETLTLAVLRC